MRIFLRLLFIALTIAIFTHNFSCQKNKQAPTKEQAEILPYDENANANLEITRAIEKASVTNKKIMLVFGANWCKWCKALHKFVETDVEIHRTLINTFEVVWIDVGKRNKNMDIDAKYGSPAAKGGIPVIVILDGNGKFLAVQETGVLENPEEKDNPVGYNREKVLHFLQGWAGRVTTQILNFD